MRYWDPERPKLSNGWPTICYKQWKPMIVLPTVGVSPTEDGRWHVEIFVCYKGYTARHLHGDFELALLTEILGEFAEDPELCMEQRFGWSWMPDTSSGEGSILRRSSVGGGPRKEPKAGVVVNLEDLGL